MIPPSTEETYLRSRLLRIDPSKANSLLSLSLSILPSDGEGFLLLLISGVFMDPCLASQLFHNLCPQLPPIIIPCITNMPLF